MSCAMLLDMSADTFPGRVAVTSGNRSLTYHELRQAAQEVAARLRAGQYRYAALLDTQGLTAPVLLSASERRKVSTAVPAYSLGLSARVRPETVIAAPGGTTYTWFGERTVPSSTWFTGIAVSLAKRWTSMLS